MTPGFGFSVGDFVSAIGLIRQVSKALKSTGGASAEYQNVIIELKALENVLRHLETLEPTEDNANHVNAVRGMALACQLPLRDFMVKIEKYERSLGPWSERTAFGSAGRKAQWAVSFAEEVEKIRALVAAKHIGINLLLSTHSSQTLSKMNTRATKEHGDLMSKIALQRTSLQHIQTQVEQLKDGLNDRAAADRARLDAISSTTDATQASVLSLRSLGNQIMSHISKFPRDIRDLLRKILWSNWQIYQVLLLLEAKITPNPTMLLGSNIKFEDALGVYTELPYEFFRHWELFEGFLRTQFKDKPGEDKISKGLFHIIDVKNKGAIVKKEHWHRSISPGAMLTMSMIMSYLRRQTGSCPRPDCIGVGLSESGESNVLVCGTCRLKYYPFSADSENYISHSDIAEDELIVQKQAEEDLQLYGSRPEPPEAVEIDEVTQLAELQLPPLRSAAEFKWVIGRPANVRKKRESKACDSQAITTVDWNSGASPLDAWLNQSAVPLEFGIPENHYRGQKPSEADLITQEVKEINVFRNVHVDLTAPHRKSEVLLFNDVLNLPSGAQIYYRKIMDRYPSLPTYLGRRLASANTSRAERLRLALAVERVALRELEQYILKHPTIHHGINKSAPWMPDTDPSPSASSDSDLESSSDSHHRAETQILPASCFWTGGSPSPRRRSSMNSLLRGHTALEPEEQESIFSKTRSRASSGEFTSASRGLPPPPVKLSKHGKLSFECDICGRTVQVEHRLDWQEHVFADLRPYVCSFRDCDLADEQYMTKGDWLIHEYLNHIDKIETGQFRTGKNPDQPSELLLCPFCGKRTDQGELARGQHLGRHMEEIALAVVTRLYENWDFYSNSSYSSNSSSPSEHATDAHQPLGGRGSRTHQDDLAGHLNGTTKAFTGVAKARRQS